VENTSLSASIRVIYKMRIPSGLIHDNTHHFTKRGEAEADMKIETVFTLKAGAERVDCMTSLNNEAKNHRLRVFFPTGISSAKNSAAETPFDVAERVIERSPEHPYSEALNPQYPCLRFVDVSDGKNGFAMLTKGIHEYEVTDDERRAVALTLLRSFEVTLCTVTYRWERRPEQELSQELGPHLMEYSIYPHKSGWDKGKVMQEAEHFNLPLESGQSAPLQADEVEGVDLLPTKHSFLEIKPAELMLSALKKAENSSDLVLRIYNPTKRKIKGSVILSEKIKKASIINMKEESIRGGTLKPRGKILPVELEPGKILTLRLN